jgi:hypothetical protein
MTFGQAVAYTLDLEDEASLLGSEWAGGAWSDRERQRLRGHIRLDTLIYC